jgi:hypothetical protein
LNNETYIDILRRLRDAVRRKCPEKWRTNSYFPNENAPAPRSVFVNHLFTQNSVTTLEHPPYSPDLTPADFSPVRRPRSALKGRLFRIVTNVIKNATEQRKGFHRVASINVSNTFTHFGEDAQLQEGTTLNKMQSK